MVSHVNKPIGKSIFDFQIREQQFVSPGTSLNTTSVSSKIKVNGGSLINKRYKSSKLPPQTTNILLHAWRDSTRGKYESILKKWELYCGQRDENPFEVHINIILEFLTDMFEQGNSYSYISSARSALASIMSVKGFNKLSDHPLISRFIKGVYHLRRPMPQYTYTWDINLIFEYLKTLDDNNKLDLKTLNQKLAILLLLLSGQRCSTLLSFDIEFMDLHNETCIFYPKALLKHSRPHQTKDVFIYNKFEQEPKSCPIAAITEYIKRRTEY